MKKRFIIKKESTAETSFNTEDTETTEDDSTTFTSEFQTTESENLDSDEYYTETADTETTETSETNQNYFKKLRDIKYIKPRGGTKQDLFTKDEIINRLQNTIPLKTMEEKKILSQLPYFKTWLRYFNTKTRKFRIGGVLLRAVYPDYLILGNINNKVSWTVQIKDCIFYVMDPKLKEARDREKNKKEPTEEDKIKEKLYHLYKQGKLSRIE